MGYCGRCNTGYNTAKNTTTFLGVVRIADKCQTEATSGKVTNCATYEVTVANASACYQCKANYVLASAACTSNSVLYKENCRVQSSATVCTTCMETFIFDGTKCAASAKVFVLALISLAALFFN